MAAKGSPKRGADGCTDRCGYYLKLPDHSQQERDPWYDWDYPDLRLNWGEPMHWDLDMETYPTYQPVGPKQYPYNNLYLEGGGNPNKEPKPVFHCEI
eukprot:bmy_06007T0